MPRSTTSAQVRILVVAGDRAATRRIASTLNESGYSDVVGTSSAARALRLCRANRPSLVILDSCIGDLSSYDIAERLYDGTDSTEPLNMFMVAEDAEEVPRIQARMLNATGVSLRPVAVSNLTREIQAAFLNSQN